MTAIASERVKLATIRTTAALVASAIGVVTLAAVVHVVGFRIDLIDTADEQRRILLDIGTSLGVMFAAISGSLAITTELRYGTIRPTLLKQPCRRRVLAAKAQSQLVLGAAVAGVTVGYAVALAAALLRARGLDLQLGSGAIARLIAGSALGGALSALAGLSIGTIVRNQVPVVVGLLVWLLFLESLLRAGVPRVGRFAPGSLGRAIAGRDEGALASPVAAAVLLTAFALAVLAASAVTFDRRDID